MKTIHLAIPERAGRLEPLCAVYATSCLPVIRQLLAEHRLRVNGIAAEVRTRVLAEPEWRALDPAGDSFLSINTLEDFTKLHERAGSLGFLLQRDSSPPC